MLRAQPSRPPKTPSSPPSGVKSQAKHPRAVRRASRPGRFAVATALTRGCACGDGPCAHCRVGRGECADAFVAGRGGGPGRVRRKTVGVEIVGGGARSRRFGRWKPTARSHRGSQISGASDEWVATVGSVVPNELARHVHDPRLPIEHARSLARRRHTMWRLGHHTPQGRPRRAGGRESRPISGRRRSGPTAPGGRTRCSRRSRARPVTGP